MSRDNIVWCDWCGNPMMAFDVVRTGMGRGWQLVYLCLGYRGEFPCAHEREQVAQTHVDVWIVTAVWRHKLLKALLNKASNEQR